MTGGVCRVFFADFYNGSLNTVIHRAATQQQPPLQKANSSWGERGCRPSKCSNVWYKSKMNPKPTTKAGFYTKTFCSNLIKYTNNVL